MTASSCHEWWWCSGDVSAVSEDEQLQWVMTECSGDAGDVSAMSEDEQLQWAMTESIKSSTTAAASVISPSNSPYHSLCFALLLCSPVCLSVCLSVCVCVCVRACVCVCVFLACISCCCICMLCKSLTSYVVVLEELPQLITAGCIRKRAYYYHENVIIFTNTAVCQ